jgi:PAS domain S-box-containing protein
MYINKVLEVKKMNFPIDKAILNALDSVNDGISICDKNGVIIYLNEAAYKIVGAEKNDILNHAVARISPDKSMLINVLEKKKSIIDVEYFWSFKGKKFHLINSGYPIFDDYGEIVGAIDIFRSIERSRKLANSIAGHQAFFNFEDIIGESDSIKSVINLAKIFSNNDENILIHGETGTGKELFAQSIHNYSNRRNNPFVALNCATLPSELIDSELFGYEEGAFTGAKKGGKSGKFELANGGTLFLDELGEMQIHIQAKLLRVLETMCINRIGSSKPIQVDVRIIAATNRNLEEMVRNGQFRQDLYYRLKVLNLEIPPLRSREEDILLLSNYFLDKLSKKANKLIKHISEEGKSMLLNHTWDGNVRELENIMSRAIYMCDSDTITKDLLIQSGLETKTYDQIQQKKLTKLSKDILSKTLVKTKGNKREAANLLNISRPTLYKYLKKYNL